MVSALALVVLAPVSFARVPKPDARATYRLGAVIDLDGEGDVQFQGTLTERVKSIENGLVTTVVESQISVDMNGVNRQGLPLESVRVERLDGGIVASAKVDGTLLFATPRVDRLRAFYFPSKPVETGAGWWRTEERGDPASPPFASYMVFVGEEKYGARDTLKVSIDANEVDEARPVHVKGMVLIDKADGSLVHGQWAIEGFAFSPTAPSRTARYELTRTD